MASLEEPDNNLSRASELPDDAAKQIRDIGFDSQRNVSPAIKVSG